MDGGDVALGVLVHAGAAHQIRAHQAHLAAEGQPLELRRRHLKEVALVDPHLAGEGHLAGGGVARVPVGVVGQGEHLALVGGVVVNDELHRLQHGHAALGVQLQLGAEHRLQLAHVHQIFRLGDARTPHKLKDAGGGVAAAAQTGQGGHPGVVPAVHDALFHQLAQIALAHDGVGHVEAGKFALLGKLAAEHVGDDPVIQRAVVLKFQTAQAVGDALQRVLNGVGVVVQRVDAPLVPLTVVVEVLDAVDGRVPHVHVGAGQIDLGAQRAAAVLELPGTHAAEQVEVFLGGAVPVGGGAAGLACVVAAVFLHFLAGQVVHVGLALQNQLLGKLVALFKVIAAVEDAAVWLRAQPFQVGQNALDVLVPLAGGVGVVIAQVELPAVMLGDLIVDVDGLGRADVQIAVGLRREPGVDVVHLALGQIGVNDVRQKVGKFFVCHTSPLQN